MRQRSLPLFPTRGKPRACAEPKPPSPKEFALHRAVADHLRAYARHDWRWSHFPSGEKRDKRSAAKLKAMGLQPGWSDFLLLAPVAADRPGGLVHMLELKRRGEDLTKSQEDLAAWCAEHGVPFACNDDLLEAIATLTSWGVLRSRIA